MKLKLFKNNYMVFFSLLVFAFINTFLFLHNFNFQTQTGDFSFHLARIKGLSSILEGPINYDVLGNFGSGAFIFYPNLTLLPATFIYTLSGNLLFSYIIYVYLLSIVTIIIAYYCGKAFFNRRLYAYLFSVIYLFAPYRLTDLFYRGAVPEGMVFAFLPIFFLGLYSILFTEEKKHWYLLYVGMTLIIYTHVLSAMICIVVGILFFGIFIVEEKRNSEILRVVKKIVYSATLTILLTAFFWLPALVQSFSGILAPNKKELSLMAVSMSDIFLNALNNNLAFFGIGIIGIITLTIPIFIYNKLTKKIKILWFLSLLFLIMSTKIFPWTLLQRTPLNIIQFPWRFLEIEMFLSSILLVMIIRLFPIKDIKKFTSILFVILISLTFSASVNLRRTLISDPQRCEISQHNIKNIVREGTSYALFDYAPSNIVNFEDEMKNHEFKIDDHWKKIKYATNGNKYSFNVTTKKDGEVVVPIFYYNGLTVSVNGQAKSISANNNGMSKVKLEHGLNKVEIHSRYDGMYYVGLILSALTCIISVVISVRKWLNIYNKKNTG